MTNPVKNPILVMKMDPTPLRDSVFKYLREGVCEVTFTKVNGERRTMPCTLKPELLPQKDQKELTFETLKDNNKDAISVWCTDAAAWRSFKLSNLIEIIPVKDE